MADEAFREILQSLVNIALKQDQINDDFRAFGAEVRTAIVEIKATQQQIAALLERLVNPSGNGHGGAAR